MTKGLTVTLRAGTPGGNPQKLHTVELDGRTFAPYIHHVSARVGLDANNILTAPEFVVSFRTAGEGVNVVGVKDLAAHLVPPSTVAYRTDPETVSVPGLLPTACAELEHLGNGRWDLRLPFRKDPAHPGVIDLESIGSQFASVQYTGTTLDVILAPSGPVTWRTIDPEPKADADET